MKRAQRSQLREILLTELTNSVETIHWKIGDSIDVEQSIHISKATADLKNAIRHLTEVI